MYLQKTICLNMIVKNERHIIRETLDNLANYIKFSYWVISDTGSTDGTQEFIKEYFREKNIPGELFEDEWQDFAHNRNRAMEHAFDKSDYLFFFDADDLIHGDFKFPDKLDKDTYKFKFGTGFTYDRICLINNREKIAKYLGVLHESLHVYKPNFTNEMVDGEYHFESRNLGDRSKNPDKYKNDAEVLEKAFHNENTDLGLKYRYAYYCAQSYRDAHLIEKSTEWFKLFLDLPAGNQYKYCACDNLGDNYKKLNNMEEAVNYWYKAIPFDRERRESVVKIMEYYFNKSNHFAVNMLYEKMKHYKLTNPDDRIFLDMTRYHDIDYFNSISSCNIGEWMSGYYSCKNLLLNDKWTEITLQNFTCYGMNMHLDPDKQPFIDKLLELFEKYFDSKKELVKNLWNMVSKHIKEYIPDKFEPLDDKYNAYFNKIYNTRDEIINSIINNKQDVNYLEIGVEYGTTIKNINTLNKTAIDPDPKFENIGEFSNINLIKLTSDEYFANLDDIYKINTIEEDHKFDIIFLDGMHQVEYIIKDIYNSLNYIKSDGKIFIDDILPIKEREQRKIPEKHYYENGILKYGESWTGDIWKVIYYLLLNFEDYFDIEVYNNSHQYRGVLMLSNINKFNILINEQILEIINNYTYKNDFNNYKSLLNKKSTIKLAFCKLDDKYNERENKTQHKIPLEEASNKILIYTGYMNFLWNDSTLNKKAIGGAEKAVIYLSRCLPKNYEIYIAGDQLEEELDNIKYINHSNLQKLLDENNFHTIIVSRYVSFFEEFDNIKCYKMLLSAHDSTGFINFKVKNMSVNDILFNCNDHIDNVICLTKWHSSNIVERHPFLKEKINIINNGIDISKFIYDKPKVRNKFVWSSCSYRGLIILLNLWEELLESIPDATLDICSYDTFPKNKQDEKMLEIINKHSSITHHGKLNTKQLYDLMSISEYWLYTNTFPETSCITAMEMLMSGVICLYYPLAGLVDTIGNYGIQVKSGNEIETLMNLSEENKTELIKNGKEYALTCSWKNRAKQWTNMLGLDIKNHKIGIFNSFPFHYEMFGFILNYAKNNEILVDIFTNMQNDLGWIDFYKRKFNNFNIIDFKKFEGNTNNYSTFFVTTDDDPLFKTEWIDNNVVCLNHYYKIRSPNFKHYLNVANFKDSPLEYSYPCYPLINYKEKKQNTNVCVIGASYGLDFNIINKLCSNNKIQLNIFVRKSHNIDITELDTTKFNINFVEDIHTNNMIKLLKQSSYILINYNSHPYRENGIICSGSLQLALSTLCKPIMTRNSNKYLQIENALEFDINSNEPINIDREIDFEAIEQERNKYVDKFDKYLNNIKQIYNFEHDKNIPHICVLYNIPHRETIKYNNWNDGFAEAIKMLMSNENYKIDFINDSDNKNINFKEYDLILFKESFNGTIYNKYIKYITNTKIGLFISSSNIIPTDVEIHKYDILFYETYWYYNYANLKRHSLSFHAFGINSNVMNPHRCEKIYDNIFVGAIIDFKNPLKIINKPGNNLCIGNVIDKNIEVQLKNNNVIVEDYVDHLSLSNKYNQSKNCFLPCSLHGGGERAVLEARSCNIKVEIDENNGKLKELLNSPIYNQDYYYSQILLGFAKIFNKPFEKKTLNLIYHKDRGYGNFGDELSKFITRNLINNEKYNLVTNMPSSDSKYINIIVIGSYIQCAPNNCTIFGSGIRTNPPIEFNSHKYNNLNIKAVRGPLTKQFLEKKNIFVPDIYGDPALLLSLFYKPNYIPELQDKIGLVPHISNYELYLKKTIPKNFTLICPFDKWENVIDQIYSCKYIVSSALHGLICSDAYNKPNIWLNEFKLNEGEFKFKDYFLSQNRNWINISNIEEFDETKLYTQGNTINLEKLKNAFNYI